VEFPLVAASSLFLRALPVRWLGMGSRMVEFTFGFTRLLTGPLVRGAAFVVVAGGLVGCADLTAEPLGEAAAFADRTGAAPTPVGVGVRDDDGTPAPRGPPYPVILVHGFSGWDEVVGGVGYFYGIVDDYRAAGVDVTAPALPPYNSSEQRATVLARVVDDVLARTGRRKVHLVAHSQGGLDSRVLLTDLGYADRVAALVTISTPHRGTAVADIADLAPDGALNPAGQFLGWLLGALGGSPPDEAGWLAGTDVDVAYDPALAQSIVSLRTSTAEAFNSAHPDPPGVRMFSVAGVSNLLSTDHPACNDGAWGRSDTRDVVDPLFAASGAYLSTVGDASVLDPAPNDGLVTVASSRWGLFLGCIPADHADEIGQVADDGPALVSGFDHRAFYARLLALLRDVEVHER
jgi:triacylglycerol lipase